MKKYFYDLHNHSCLSPCADDDNTPNNLCGMASLSGIDILALTDHNTCKNCPSFFEAAEKYGIIPIAGMELTTSEDIHVVCLFENLEDAMSFDHFIEGSRLLIKNRPEIFGEQLILDKDDNLIGKEEFLLSNATDISIENAPDLVHQFNGICYPAHIDRNANGIIEILGTFPVTPYFKCFEICNEDKLAEYVTKYDLKEKLAIISSDTHHLEDMRDGINYFVTEDSLDGEAVRKKLFELLR